jgi:hypothetical protein
MLRLPLLFSLALGALATGLPARPAAAMTILLVDLKTLVADADLVLHGTVDRTQVLDRRKEGRSVWTEWTLRVTEVWKGDKSLEGKPFSWRHVGGTTPDGMTVAVPGMPGFAAGEEVVIVLEKTSETWVVSGGPQGKFVVSKDKLGRKQVTREFHDVAALQRDATGQMREAKPVPLTKLLPDFRTEVLGYVADAAKAKAVKPVVAPVPARSPVAK